MRARSGMYVNVMVLGYGQHGNTMRMGRTDTCQLPPANPEYKSGTQRNTRRDSKYNRDDDAGRHAARLCRGCVSGDVCRPCAWEGVWHCRRGTRGHGVSQARARAGGQCVPPDRALLTGGRAGPCRARAICARCARNGPGRRGIRASRTGHTRLHPAPVDLGAEPGVAQADGGRLRRARRLGVAAVLGARAARAGLRAPVRVGLAVAGTCADVFGCCAQRCRKRILWA